MHRCIDEMEIGQVLEVISRSQQSLWEVITWCHINNHKLLDVAYRDDEILFWIKK